MEYLQNVRQKYYENLLPTADPRTKDWFLLNNSPIYMWTLTLTYLVFVWLGPKYMRSRTPFNLQYLMVIYNIALVLLSVYMFAEIIISSIEAGYGFFCAPYSEVIRERPKELRVAKVLWWYYFSKAIELNDTVLMILRKKMTQVTFLHVFHHATMLNIWWWVMMFIPGGLSIFGSCLNCLVHVVMYLYYGLSAVPSLKGKLWWKRYITRFQLIQFCLTLSHTLYSIYMGCDFPPWGQQLLAGYMICMLILFTNFYIHAYVMKKRNAKSKQLDISENGTANGKVMANGKNGVKKNGIDGKKYH